MNTQPRTPRNLLVLLALLTVLASLMPMAVESHAEVASVRSNSLIPTPGVAKAEQREDTLTLWNQGILATWEFGDGLRLQAFENRWTDETSELDAEPFRLVFQGETEVDRIEIDGSSLEQIGTPKPLTLDADPEAARLAERKPGKGFEIVLRAPEQHLEIVWRALLRDDTSYLRTEVLLRPLDADSPVARIEMLDLPVAAVPNIEISGTVDGSPLVFGDSFAGFEHPMATALVDEGRARASIDRLLPIRQGTEVVYSAVLGSTPPGQLRRGFLDYIEHERAHPYRPFLHYNSWYDIGYFTPYDEADALGSIRKYGKELVETRGVTLDSFLFDDGWDNTATVWEFHEGFPNGFLPLKEETAKYGASPGVWLSPWGGYGPPRDRRLATGKAAGYEVDEQGYALSGPKYFPRFREVTGDLLDRYGINQFKLDGTGSPDKTTPGSEFDSDFAAAIHLIDELREQKPDLFINLTTGTWPSPFWLRTADSIWRGGWDHELAGVGSHRQQWITYRDADTYSGIVQRGPLYPLNSLMLHGLIYARHARGLADDPHGEFRDEIHSYFGSGTQLQEMYISPDLLTKENWDDLAEAANWARDNAQVLRDSHWIGGDPAALEVYGWASWSPLRSIIVLRNPADQPQAFSLDIERALELPGSAISHLAAREVFTDPDDEADYEKPLVLLGGSPATLRLDPFEVRVLELSATAMMPTVPFEAPEGAALPGQDPKRTDFIPGTVACVGETLANEPGDDLCPRIAGLLRSGLETGAEGKVSAKSFGGPAATLSESRQQLERLAEFAPETLVVRLGTGNADQETWSRTGRTWVPRFRTLLADLKALPGSPRVIVLRPDERLVAPADPRRKTLAEEVGPLTVQAAREAGLETGDIVDLAFLPNVADNPADVTKAVAESAYLALADSKTRKTGWSVTASSEAADWSKAGFAIDGDPTTFWMTQHWRGGPRHPHHLAIDLGSEQALDALVLWPLQNGSRTGRPRQIEIRTSDDGETWSDPVVTRSLPDTHRAIRVDLPENTKARHLKLEVFSEVDGGRGAALAEIDVVPTVEETDAP